MGLATDNTQHTEVDMGMMDNVDKPPTKITPSSANYGGYCSTCSGSISNQFPECMCSAMWIPCHGCHMYVARHQPCAFGHEVDYPSECKPLF